MKLMAIDDNLWLVYTEKLLSMVFLCIFRKYNQQNNMKCGSIANNPIIQTINIFMAFIKKNFLYHASTMCVAESSEDFGRVCDSSYSEVSSSDGSSN